jgi:hypothetical protein
MLFLFILLCVKRIDGTLTVNSSHCVIFRQDAHKKKEEEEEDNNNNVVFCLYTFQVERFAQSVPVLLCHFSPVESCAPALAPAVGLRYSHPYRTPSPV